MEEKVFQDIFNALREATLIAVTKAEDYKTNAKDLKDGLNAVSQIGCYRALDEITRIFSEVGAKHYNNKENK